MSAMLELGTAFSDASQPLPLPWLPHSFITDHCHAVDTFFSKSVWVFFVLSQDSWFKFLQHQQQQQQQPKMRPDADQSENRTAIKQAGRLMKEVETNATT